MMKKVWAILLFGRHPCVFSQPFQNQRCVVRSEAACTARHCTVDIGYLGLVVCKRKVRGKLGILSLRVSCEETSGTLLKIGLEIKQPSRHFTSSVNLWSLIF